MKERVGAGVLLLLVASGCGGSAESAGEGADAATGGTGPSETAEGSFTDGRDARSYRWVRIGSQTWMAENLDYTDGTLGTCYDDLPESCATDGRLYTWAEAMQGAASSELVPSGVPGICPAGWHLPSREEWSLLLDFVEADGAEGSAIALRAATGWEGEPGGTDAYGFAVPAAGRGLSSGGYMNRGTDAWLWSTTAASDTISGVANFDLPFSNVVLDLVANTAFVSVRCVQNPNPNP